MKLSLFFADNGEPLAPCHPARLRQLIKAGRVVMEGGSPKAVFRHSGAPTKPQLTPLAEGQDHA